MKISTINAITIDDAWHQCLNECVNEGKIYTIDHGSFQGQERLELDYLTLRIRRPEAQPMRPTISECKNIPEPISKSHLNDYLKYVLTPEKKISESYTYGERLWKNERQIDYLIHTYKIHGHRNNQMILQIGKPSDIFMESPPCLRHIDTKIQDGKLHFFPYFRSWDLWAGMPANLIAIEFLKQYCAIMLNIENGEIVASSKGAHVYDYVFEYVNELTIRNACM